MTLVNNQPMGFYPLETIKEDARRFGVTFLNPCVNRSQARCIPDGGYLLLGLGLIKDVGEESAGAIVDERERNGPYTTPGDLVRRTGLKPQAVLSLDDGRGLRRPQPQPPRGAVGGRSLC